MEEREPKDQGLKVGNKAEPQCVYCLTYGLAGKGLCSSDFFNVT